MASQAADLSVVQSYGLLQAASECSVLAAESPAECQMRGSSITVFKFSKVGGNPPPARLAPPPRSERARGGVEILKGSGEAKNEKVHEHLCQPLQQNTSSTTASADDSSHMGSAKRVSPILNCLAFFEYFFRKSARRPVPLSAPMQIAATLPFRLGAPMINLATAHLFNFFRDQVLNMRRQKACVCSRRKLSGTVLTRRVVDVPRAGRGS